MYHFVECPYCQKENFVEEENDIIVCEECQEIFDYEIDENGNVNTDTFFNS